MDCPPACPTRSLRAALARGLGFLPPDSLSVTRPQGTFQNEATAKNRTQEPCPPSCLY